MKHDPWHTGRKAKQYHAEGALTDAELADIERHRVLSLRPGWADVAGAAAGAQEREERHTAKAPPRFSAAAREKMAASHRARWAKIREARGQK